MSRWRKKRPTDFFLKRLKKIDISIDEVPRLPVGLQSNHYKHDRSSVSACRWSWSSHRSKRQELRYALWLLRSWARADIRITILTSFFDNTHVQENRTSYWSSSYTQFQCDVLDARSNEKASRRSQRSESEEQRWSSSEISKIMQHAIQPATHKRLDRSDHHHSLQNVNVTIDSSSIQHRNWWRWKNTLKEKKSLDTLDAELRINRISKKCMIK